MCKSSVTYLLTKNYFRISIRANFVWWSRKDAMRRRESKRCSICCMSASASWRRWPNRSVSSCTSAYSCAIWRMKRGRSTCGYTTTKRWSWPVSCARAPCPNRNNWRRSSNNSTSQSRFDSVLQYRYDASDFVWSKKNCEHQWWADPCHLVREGNFFSEDFFGIVLVELSIFRGDWLRFVILIFYQFT